MMTDDTPVDAEPILAITERAGERIRTFLPAGAGEPEQAVWVEITGVADDAYTYNLTLLPPSTARPGDAVQRIDDLVVVVGRNDRERLRGATVDWIDTATGGGLTVLNPNKPPPKAPVGLPMSPAAAPPASPAVGIRPSAGRTGAPGSLMPPSRRGPHLIRSIPQSPATAVSSPGSKPPFSRSSQRRTSARLLLFVEVVEKPQASAPAGST